MKLAGVTASQFVKTGMIAVLFIILFKYIAGRSNIAGLQSIASMA